jgi:uncharacterized repeat protein (TIGR02543 family)
MPSSAHVYDTPENLSANSFTRAGFTFTGWATSAEGSVVYTDGQSVTNLATTGGAAVNLYAQWQHSVPVEISVWVNEDGNILVSSNDITISKAGSGGNQAGFSAEVNGTYSSIQWYLNNDPIYGSRGTARSITISAADYTNGSYRLGVTVIRGGVPYSTYIRFTVTN